MAGRKQIRIGRESEFWSRLELMRSRGLFDDPVDPGGFRLTSGRLEEIREEEAGSDWRFVSRDTPVGADPWEIFLSIPGGAVVRGAEDFRDSSLGGDCGRGWEPELLYRYLMARQSGVKPIVACRFSTLSAGDVSRWVQEGMELFAEGIRDDPRVRFWRAVEETDAIIEMVLSGVVMQAGRTDWKAALEYLKANFPERWAGVRSRIELRLAETSGLRMDDGVEARDRLIAGFESNEGLPGYVAG